MMVGGCAAAPVIISGTFMGLYWALYAQVAKMNDNPLNINVYDMCGVAALSQGNVAFNTKWSVGITLNAATYTVLFATLCCQIFSICAWPLAFLALCGQMCGGCLHLAAIIVMGVFRYSTEGEACALNNMKMEGLDWTFKEHGDMLAGMFISQAVLLIFFGCCVGVLTQITWMAAALKKALGKMR